jgi:hypothetical protein
LVRRDNDVDIGSGGDVAATTAALQQCLLRFTGESAANGDELAELCRRIHTGEGRERHPEQEGDR